MAITVRLMGGLANQLFQWAYGEALVRKGYSVNFDSSKLIEGTHREFSLGFLGVLPEKQDSSNLVHESSMLYDPKMLEPVDPSTMIGYWQSEKYFESFADDIRRKFFGVMYRSIFSSAAEQMEYEIYKHSGIAIHVRRKDYVDFQSFHGLPTIEYYRNAVKYIRERRPYDLKVFVFSDDKEWCRENFPKDFTIVDGTNKYEDLQLMASCKDIVIANSSFSWWGAWLGDNQFGRFVIAPKHWFANDIKEEIVPGRWVKLDY